MSIKYYRIFIDGIDKSGKDTIASYIDILSNHKYVVKARGILSMVAYSHLYERNYDYEIDEQNTVNVLINVEKQDWLVRCKYTSEKKINYEKNVKAFEFAKTELLKKMSTSCILLEYNSSYKTAYEIALEILQTMEELNNE